MLPQLLGGVAKRAVDSISNTARRKSVEEKREKERERETRENLLGQQNQVCATPRQVDDHG
jgi:hypothetical protein